MLPYQENNGKNVEVESVIKVGQAFLPVLREPSEPAKSKLI